VSDEKENTKIYDFIFQVNNLREATHLLDIGVTNDYNCYTNVKKMGGKYEL